MNSQGQGVVSEPAQGAAGEAAVAEQQAWSTAVGRLRIVGAIEGVSYLLLLGVAMPLKYLAGVPMAVKVVGWLHGVLFVALCVALVLAWRATRWSWAQSALVFVAALLPFGPFLVDRRLKAYERPS